MLITKGLAKSFGGVYAVRDVTIDVADGETRGIIGPNGAGKTTLFHLISGHHRPDAGSVELAGRRIDTLPPHRRARLGVAIVFQNARLFGDLTVLENVMVGAHSRYRSGFLSAALRLPRTWRDEKAIKLRAEAALDRIGLGGWAKRKAAGLPLGQQRSLQVARALCAEPRLLLLDEPAAGLRAAEREAFVELLGGLKRQGVTTMLIEHDVAFVSKLADRVTVLDLGEVIADGTPDEIRREPRVIKAYLGEPTDA